MCRARSDRRRNGVVCHDLKIISITLAFSSAVYLVATNRETKAKDILRPNISKPTHPERTKRTNKKNMSKKTEPNRDYSGHPRRDFVVAAKLSRLNTTV